MSEALPSLNFTSSHRHPRPSMTIKICGLPSRGRDGQRGGIVVVSWWYRGGERGGYGRRIYARTNLKCISTTPTTHEFYFAST